MGKFDACYCHDIFLKFPNNQRSMRPLTTNDLMHTKYDIQEVLGCICQNLDNSDATLANCGVLL